MKSPVALFKKKSRKTGACFARIVLVFKNQKSKSYQHCCTLFA